MNEFKVGDLCKLRGIVARGLWSTALALRTGTIEIQLIYVIIEIIVYSNIRYLRLMQLPQLTRVSGVYAARDFVHV